MEVDVVRNMCQVNEALCYVGRTGEYRLSKIGVIRQDKNNQNWQHGEKPKTAAHGFWLNAVEKTFVVVLVGGEGY